MGWLQVLADVMWWNIGADCGCKMGNMLHHLQKNYSWRGEEGGGVVCN